MYDSRSEIRRVAGAVKGCIDILQLLIAGQSLMVTGKKAEKAAMAADLQDLGAGLEVLAAGIADLVPPDVQDAVPT